MRNFKFKLSNMMPNTWFYKLKDMSKTKNHPTKKNFSKLYEQNQAYFYYTMETNHKQKHSNSPKNNKISDTQILEPSRKSSKKARRKTIYRPSATHISTTSYSSFNKSEQIHASSSTQTSTDELDFVKSSSSEFESNNTLDGFNGLASWSTSYNCRFISSTTDIIIDVNEHPFKGKLETFDNLCESSELNLPRIQTRLPNSCNNSSSEMDIMKKIINLENVKIKKEKSATKILSRKSTGVKVGTKSPKLSSKKLKIKSRRSVHLEKHSRTQKNTFSESFAVVKVSINPKKDFRDSMIEMIVENNIETSKELEDLLACFLSLNSDEYHDVIIEAFEQIWFNMSKIN